MLVAAVGVTTGAVFVTRTPNTSSAIFILHLLPTARALSCVGLLLVLSALVMMFAVVMTTIPIMAKY